LVWSSSADLAYSGPGGRRCVGAWRCGYRRRPKTGGSRTRRPGGSRCGRSGLYEVPSWLWVAALGLVALLLTVDYVIAYHRRGPVGLREATVWSVFYIVVALLFGLG